MIGTELILYDSGFTGVAILDDYVSIEETVRWYSTSSLKLRMSRFAAGAELLGTSIDTGTTYYLAFRQDDDNIVYLVEQVERELDEDGNVTDNVIVSAREAAMTTERVALPVPGQMYDSFTGPAMDAMIHYAENNLGSGASASRQVPNLTVGVGIGLGETVEVNARYDTVEDLLASIGEMSPDIGWRAVLDSGGILFQVVQGSDLSTEVYFSHQFDNLKNSKYLNTVLGKKTFGVAAGQGEGAAREIAEVWVGGAEPTGLERREVFIDARDIDETEAGPGALAARGQEKLAGMQPKASFEADLYVYGNYQYGEDWRLGDLITLRNEQWGITQAVRVVTVTKVRSPDGVDVKAELDSPWPSIKDRIKSAAGSSGSSTVDYPRSVPAAGGVFSGLIRFVNNDDATLVDGTGVLQVGADGAANLGLDGNEIQARNGSGGSSVLHLNNDGGSVRFGGNLEPQGTTQLVFPNNTQEKIRLYSTTYTLGVASSTLFLKSGRFFRFYDDAVDPMSGTGYSMELDAENSVLTLAGSTARVDFTSDAGPLGFHFSNGECRLYYRTSPNTLGVETSSGTAVMEWDVDDLKTTARGDVEILNSSPTIRLIDTSTTDNFFIHVNSNNFYILADRNNDGSWETPHPFMYEGDLNQATIGGNLDVSGNLESSGWTSAAGGTLYIGGSGAEIRFANSTQHRLRKSGDTMVLDVAGDYFQFVSVADNNVSFTRRLASAAGSLKLMYSASAAGGIAVDIRNGADSGYHRIRALDFVPSSDRGLKANLTRWGGALGRLREMKAYRYDRVDTPDAGRILGFMADEMPSEIVRGRPGDEGIALGEFQTFTVVAVQELAQEHDRLAARVAALETAQA